jgi:UDP-N-acetyl-2-amino-2-deoxyglucuronate dehydrogenase
MSACTSSKESQLGLAIVGCGQIVTHHLHEIQKLGSYQVRALCDPSPHRRQAIQEIAATCTDDCDSNNSNAPAQYDSLDDLMKDETVFATVHIIFIAVPHDLHERLALQALSTSNRIVVMEKPLAPTGASCDKLVQTSRDLLASSDAGGARAAMLIIAEQSPYWQEVVKARILIADGAIGQVVSAAGYYYESMRDNVTSGDVAEDGGLGWRGSLKRAGGGIVIDGGLHWIRPLREMCGRIQSVVGVTRKNLAPDLQMEGETLAHALFQMEEDEDTVEALRQPQGSGPLVATYSSNMVSTAPMAHDICPYFRITGNKGEIVIHGDGLFKEKPGAGGLRLYNEAHPEGVEQFALDRQGGFFLGFHGLWQEVHRICKVNDQVAAHDTVVRAADDVQTALALYRSAKSGRWESTSTSS